MYLDSDRSHFTKYVNLHLGRAYEVMTPREYCEMMGVEPYDGVWQQPNI